MIRRSYTMILGAAVCVAAVALYRLQPAPVAPPSASMRPQVTVPLPAAPAAPVAALQASLPAGAPVETRTRTVEKQALAREGDVASSALSSDSAEQARSETQVTQLTQILKADPEPAHRLRAIDELKFLGRQGDSDGRINAALQAATADPDATVAVVARDAISELLN